MSTESSSSRIAFESHMTGNMEAEYRPLYLERDTQGYYTDWLTRQAWAVWEAAVDATMRRVKDDAKVPQQEK